MSCPSVRSVHQLNRWCIVIPSWPSFPATRTPYCRVYKHRQLWIQKSCERCICTTKLFVRCPHMQWKLHNRQKVCFANILSQKCCFFPKSFNRTSIFLLRFHVYILVITFKHHKNALLELSFYNLRKICQSIWLISPIALMISQTSLTHLMGGILTIHKGPAPHLKHLTWQ